MQKQIPLPNILIFTFIFFCLAEIGICADTKPLTANPPAAVVQSAMLRNWQGQKWDTASLAAEFKSHTELGSIAVEIETELESADKAMVMLDEVKTKPHIHRRTARQVIDRLQKHENKFEVIRKQLLIKRKEIEAHDQQGAASELAQKMSKLYQLVSAIARLIHDERQNIIKTML